ncbi:MAG: PilZ domain-containing protein [Spirochaetes bacterium]|nr:PilZ domain-containing protein [Spirochaetota bacterium]
MNFIYNFKLNYLFLALDVELKPADTKSILIFLIIITLVFLIIFLFGKLKNSKQFQTFLKLRSKDFKVFFDFFKEKGFTPPEINIMFKYLDQSPYPNPFVLASKKSNIESFINKILNYIPSIPVDVLSNVDKEKEKNICYNILNKLDFIYSKTQPLTSTRGIPVGKKVRIFIKEYGYFYTEVILNVEGGLIVSKPPREDIKDWLKPVTVFFFLDNDAGYSFNSTIEEEISEKHLKGLFIKHTDLLTRYQKRKFLRKEAQFYITYSFAYQKVSPDNKTKIIIDTAEYDGTVIDISAGGVSFETMKESKANQLIKLTIYMQRNNINAIGKIIRVTKKNNKYIYYVKFIKISPQEQNLIHEYIFTSKARKV